MSHDSDQQNHAEDEEDAEDGHGDGPAELFDALAPHYELAQGDAVEGSSDFHATVHDEARVLLHVLQPEQKTLHHALVAGRGVEVIAQARQRRLHVLLEDVLDHVRLRTLS